MSRRDDTPAPIAIPAGAAAASAGALEMLLSVATDLTRDLSSETRYQRLVSTLCAAFAADAAALLGLCDGVLVPLAAVGLSPDVQGRRFVADEHPRLSAIVEATEPVIFAADDPRPDPYEGLLEGIAHDPDDPAIHSCLGCALRIDGELIGVLTLDAQEPGQFDDIPERLVAAFASLAAAAMRTAGLIDALEHVAQRRGEVARQLVVDALLREGGELLGQSPVMESLDQEIDMVAPSMLTVLLTGETGTGKELAARTLHARSSRASQPLVHVNCAALPESIAESELFGHVKGAFTGAVTARLGKFELADGATLFLDEVGELPLSIQSKLLRALQFGEVQRVGSDAIKTVDVRVIAATNRDLVAEVAAGRFRADLYHRLCVYPIELPALRERGQDVLLLAGHLLDRARAHLGQRRLRISDGVRQRLLDYDWPGNVRELDHVVTRAALRAARRTQGGHDVVIIEVSDLDPLEPSVELTPAHRHAAPETSAEEAAALAPGQTLPMALQAYERRLVEQAVEACDGNWSAAARLLGVDRSNLHRIGRRLGLKD